MCTKEYPQEDVIQVLPQYSLSDSYFCVFRLSSTTLVIIYRSITAYLRLQVNCDKIMHGRWDFDASSARTRRVSVLDKHQIEAQVHYFVTILEHKVNTHLLI